MLIGIGYLIQILTTTAPIGVVFGPGHGGLHGAGTLLVVAVMCTYPLRIRSVAGADLLLAGHRHRDGRRRRLRLVLLRPLRNDLRASIFSILTGPVVMLVAVFAVAKLLVAGRPPFSAWTGVLGRRGPTTGAL